ncbi:hypothetical protein QP968_10005 [Corynebacterium sp. MSK041]|uniref:DUF6928 family protein n=1 Tax=Corynebacterium sp. MSK041 TaxID=3050194 RepID=UPI00254A9512|nr:hypothetical protein [Corynebacterium sp. MSK041]MDK8796040.1 hypothetical protein [Corynebacterium sp. MSK041]
MGVPAVVTFWYINAADPAAVLGAEPHADRGFGRKLLAQLNPRWPITPIGQFPLNRSTPSSRDEFYIAGYPGVAVLQTHIDDCGKLSDIPTHLRRAVPAADVFVFAEGVDEGAGYAGFARFNGDTVRRSLCATRNELIEDIGLPDGFEAPYWAGERADQLGGISLPFVPLDLMRAAQRDWLGVDVSPDGPDINVVAYAVDGRPEPKVEQRTPETKNVADVAAKFSSAHADYDDYEEAEETNDEFAELADASAKAARRIRRDMTQRWRALKETVKERLRHSDR